MIRLFYFTMLLFISCTAKNKNVISAEYTDVTDTIHVNPEEVDRIVLSKMIDDFDYIKLETNTYSVIGDIDKVVFGERGIYVLDVYKTNKLLLFDNEGRYIKQIGSKGRGPEQYTEASDFAVKHDKVYLYDRGGKKVIIYSMDGDFINSVKISFWADCFYPYKNELLFYTGSSINKAWGEELNFQLVYTNYKGEILKKGLAVPQYFQEYSNFVHNVFQECNGFVYFKPVPGNSVYKIAQEKINFDYHIDFGKFNTDPDIYKKNSSLRMMMPQKDFAFNIQNVLYTESIFI